MKNIKLITLLSSLFLLIGCNNVTPKEDPKEEDDPIEPGPEDPDSEDPDPENPDPEEPGDDDCPIESIYFPKESKDLLLEVNKKAYLTINFVPENVDSEYKSVTWSSSDESIATVSQYGVVNTLKEGKTIITCTTVVGERKAFSTIYVVKDKSKVEKRLERVTDYSTLASNDIIILACPEKNKVATYNVTAGYLESCDATFSNDKSRLLTYDADQVDYILDNNGEDYANVFKLENGNGKYLAAQNVKNVGFVYKTGNIHWAFDYDDEYNANIMFSTSGVGGQFMYNASHDRFTLYDSNEVDNVIFMVSLYRETIVLPN